MKIIKPTIFIILLFILTSCEIVQETKFEPNGSGRYSLGFDMSEMMKMGQSTKESNNKQIDTLIVFSKFLEEKKDSIAKLSKKEQKKIKQLENFSIAIKADSVAKKFVMKINYDFKNLEDLKTFAEKLEGQNIKELELLANKTSKPAGSDKDKKENSVLDFNKSYNTSFNSKMFSAKITPEGLEKALKKKDTTMTKDNPMSNMIRFKSRYIFPFKIKRVSNENARILSDFKGIEISGNLYEINKDPKFFDVDVEFE